MFSFHKPKIYRSISGCCICRAKSSSSRFTDSKKYETEFEKCFRIGEKRTGEICNACVLLVKRWKKLPIGTNRNWHHVVDARAGPGTKSFKNKPQVNSSGPDLKKHRFGKNANRNNSLVESKACHKSITSSESESEDDDDEEDEEETDDLEPIDSGNASDARSLRRSTRLARGPSVRTVVNPGDKVCTLHTNRANNYDKTDFVERKMLRGDAHTFVSFLDMSFWQKEKICCGVIYRGPNNEMMIIKELFSPCSCRLRQRNTTSVPKLTKPEAVHVDNNMGSSKIMSTGRKVLSHQDSFTNLSTNSESSVCSSDTGNTVRTNHEEIEDHSSGVSSMTNCDDSSSLLTPDSDLAMSDHLSTVSSSIIDVDDGSSNASSVYDTLTHHDMEMCKNVSYSPQTVV